MAFRSRKRSAEVGDHHAGDSEKRMKTEANSASDSYQRWPGASFKIDPNGDRYWEISKMRRVTISTFRGKTMVSIREYYEKDGKELPGKKGISMPMDQYAALVILLPEIEGALKESGQSVPRPNYADANEQSDGNEQSEEENDDNQGESSSNPDAPTSPKKNIEATSDEDEE